MHHTIFDNLFNTFLHSIAWHTGSKFVNMFFIPLMICFVGYGVYRYIKTRRG